MLQVDDAACLHQLETKPRKGTAVQLILVRMYPYVLYGGTGRTPYHGVMYQRSASARFGTRHPPMVTGSARVSVHIRFRLRTVRYKYKVDSPILVIFCRPPTHSSYRKYLRETFVFS